MPAMLLEPTLSEVEQIRLALNNLRRIRGMNTVSIEDWQLYYPVTMNVLLPAKTCTPTSPITPFESLVVAANACLSEAS